jgi:hypothetical protein
LFLHQSCGCLAPTEKAAQLDKLAMSFLDSLKVVQDVTYLVDIFPIPKGIISLFKHLVSDHVNRSVEYSSHTLSYISSPQIDQKIV